MQSGSEAQCDRMLQNCAKVLSVRHQMYFGGYNYILQVIVLPNDVGPVFITGGSLEHRNEVFIGLQCRRGIVMTL